MLRSYLQRKEVNTYIFSTLAAQILFTVKSSKLLNYTTKEKNNFIYIFTSTVLIHKKDKVDP